MRALRLDQPPDWTISGGQERFLSTARCARPKRGAMERRNPPVIDVRIFSTPMPCPLQEGPKLSGNFCTSKCPFQAAAKWAFCFIVVVRGKGRNLIGYVSASFQPVFRIAQNNLRFLGFRT
jgi:hypothetical protein